jgi:hypothetical protein
LLRELAEMGVRHVRYDLQRTGLNPLADLATYRGLRAIIRAEQSDQVLAYTIKPVIYGCLVGAALGGVAQFRYRLTLALFNHDFIGLAPFSPKFFMILLKVRSPKTIRGLFKRIGPNTYRRHRVQPCVDKCRISGDETGICID